MKPPAIGDSTGKVASTKAAVEAHLRITAKKSAYRPLEQIIVVAELEPLEALRVATPQGKRSGFEFQVFLPNGSTAPLTLYG